MGRTHGSRRSRLFLPLVALVSSGTVLLGAGDAVRISAPADKAVVSGTIEVKAQVSAATPVDYVLLVVDGARPASTNSSPATFQLDTRELSDGPHVVSVEAYSDLQMIASSRAITIRVRNRTAPQVVAKQPSTSKTAAAAGQLRESGTPRSAREVSAAKTAGISGTKRGPAREPSSTGLSVAEDSQRSEAAQAVASPPLPAVALNGRLVNADVSPMLVRGKLRTGFRALFAASGARIDWRADERVATCVTDSLIIEVPIGSRIATVNGRRVDMGGVATIKNGRTMVPVRFFAEVTGSRICWDARSRVASIQTPSRAVASAQTSLTPEASGQPAVADRIAARTPIYEVADRGP